MKHGGAMIVTALGLVAILIGMPAVTLAQSQTKDRPVTPSAPPPTTPAPAMEDKAGVKHVEGKVQKMVGNKLTLADGTQLTVPATVKVPKADLKAGADIKASYEEKGGEKIVTMIELAPASDTKMSPSTTPGSRTTEPKTKY